MVALLDVNCMGAQVTKDMFAPLFNLPIVVKGRTQITCRRRLNSTAGKVRSAKAEARKKGDGNEKAPRINRKGREA